MERIDIVLGDWSDDGHGKTEKYPIKVNVSKKAMQDAYKASCKKFGFSFNHNDDFTGLKRSYEEDRKYHICTEYEEPYISIEVIEIMKEHGMTDEFLCEVLEDYGDPESRQLCEEDGGRFCVNEDGLVALLMWFIKQSLPEFEWEKLADSEEIPTFNGYWDDNLNVHIGYGLYD